MASVVSLERTPPESIPPIQAFESRSDTCLMTPRLQGDHGALPLASSESKNRDYHKEPTQNWLGYHFKVGGLGVLGDIVAIPRTPVHVPWLCISSVPTLGLGIFMRAHSTQKATERRHVNPSEAIHSVLAKAFSSEG